MNKQCVYDWIKYFELIFDQIEFAQLEVSEEKYWMYIDGYNYWQYQRAIME